ncbi:unnamed protein product [Adineta ricciae]|uniref:P/Homo B domain-containing protein n=1 Tax=Adineta ricciae TaxID=249248 RepID=A0A814RK69_ADIRI|nr:unnamed protein product [Adineta ricciae]CAF1305998.1 unnamed protein product [Adineta ricciae]
MVGHELKVSWNFAVLFLNILNTNGSDNIDEDEEYIDIGVRLTDENRDQLIADLIAQEKHVISAGHIPGVDMYHFQVRRKRNRRSKRQVNQLIDELKEDERIASVTVGERLERQKRNFVSDNKLIDLYKKYKENEGQFKSPTDFDINVAPVWLAGYSGKGIAVCIVDDGLDHPHPDLADHYRPDLSYDLNDLDDPKHDPIPSSYDGQNSHGTQCAGTAAAKANNEVCGVGVAYNGDIAGIRVLDGPISTLLEARAIALFVENTDIKSASWGPADDGTKMEAPHGMTRAALEYGVTHGRQGKGTVYVWAAGNGGSKGDDCGADGYASHHNVISISSINHLGETPYFVEKCPSTLAVAYTGGQHEIFSNEERFPVGVIASDVDGKCTTTFAGTSSAAPMAAGAFALVLEANPELTYRDVMHIVAETARIPSLLEADDWLINGAGYHVSDKFGFGVLDVAQMVALAQNWTNVPPRYECYQEHTGGPLKIVIGGKLEVPIKVIQCEPITRVEHVVANISFDFPRRGDLKISVLSPSGTISEVLSCRPNDITSAGIQYFPFMTSHSWNENPIGEWILRIETCDPNAEYSDTGELQHFGLRIFGSYSPKANSKADQDKRYPRRAFVPTKREIEEIYNREFAARKSSNLMQKRDHQNLMKQKRAEAQTTTKTPDDKKSPISPIQKVIDSAKTVIKYIQEAIPTVRTIYDTIRDFFFSKKEPK